MVIANSLIYIYMYDYVNIKFIYKMFLNESEV